GAIVATGQGPRCRGGRPVGGAPCGEGQTGDIPVPVGGSVADGSARLQAPAQREARDPTPGGGPRAAAADRDERQPVEPAAGRLAVPVRKTRRQRRLDERTAAPHRKYRRRPLHRPLDEYGGDQPWSGGDVPADRFAASGPAEHGGVARLRTGERQRK